MTAVIAMPHYQAVVSARGVTKRFGPLEVLCGVDLELRAGRVTALVGPNAAGKSTLVKLILGLVRRDAGGLEIDGTDVGHDPSLRGAIGYMPQSARFPDNLTGREVVRMLRELRGHRMLEDDELFGSFGLAASLDKPVRTLSGGTRQKLSAGVAFMFRPRLLILDEPTAGLDPVASGILKDKIRRAREEGCAILISSHILSDLEELADDVVLLLEGRVEFAGTLRGLHAATGAQRLEQAVASLMRHRSG